MKKFVIMSSILIYKEYVIALIGAVVISLAFIVPAGAAGTTEHIVSEEVIALQIEAKQNHTKPHGILPQSEKRSYIVRDERMPITAYNSVPWQTDDTPCIGAQGTDICEIYATGENICAANFVPLGTVLEVEGLGTCVVRDRMNSRYHKRVDWYMGMDVPAARAFGLRTRQVSVYSR